MKMSTRFIGSALMVGVAILGMAKESSAIGRVSHPAIDFKGDYFTYPNSGGIPTSSTWITVWGSPYQAPSWGAPAQIFPFPPLPPVGMPNGFKINTFNDYIVGHNNDDLGGSTARYGAAAAYISYDDESLPTDSMTMTTIYGRDLAPSSPGVLELAGYDLGTVFPQLSDEHVVGPSGVDYAAAPGQLVPISGLSALLGPDADLSIFSGDPNASVWVFQTTMPFGEMGIPEPTTAVLVSGLALACVTAVRRR
jgi:hypothetical protein